jgi:methylthioribose-1-phosphate isomerase
MRSVWWEDGIVCLIDQRKLPWELTIARLNTHIEVIHAIENMYIRGAPAIGAAAGFALSLAASNSNAKDTITLIDELKIVSDELKKSRPTAVNLAWAVNQLMDHVTLEEIINIDDFKRKILCEAQRMADEDIKINRRMAKIGASLIQDGDTILHHCNTGSLATVNYGTALGVIRMAHEQGKEIRVLLGETRPRLQGGRLSAWELEQYGIAYHIIPDSAAGYFMRRGEVNIIFVGADRAASNGDIVNKIGTYQIAVLAKENNVPFYPVVPISTIDMLVKNGDDIVIEERDPTEVTTPYGNQLMPESFPVLNPAFDITPNKYISGIITECGIAYPPFKENLEQIIDY